MVTPLKLAEINDTIWSFTLPDGTERPYEPLSTLEKIETIDPATNPAAVSASAYDSIRVALGFPTQKDVDESTADPKPFTLSRMQCLALQANLMEFVLELDSVKKLRGLSQNL